MRSTIRDWSDRKKTVEAPLFPGYLFARVDERQRLEALNDPALVRTVAFGGELASATEVEIENLKVLQATPARIERIDRMAFPIGSNVYIDKGPLKGLRGCIVDHPKSQYLIVDVPSVRQSVRVHLPVDWVRRPAGFEVSA